MKTRILSAIVGVPLLIFLISYGGWPLVISVLFLSLVGMKEFYNAFASISQPLSMLGYGATLLYILIVLPKQQYFPLFIAVFILALLISLVFSYPKRNIMDIGVTFFGFFYVTFLFSHIFLLRNISNGIFLIWLIFISAWGSDTGAYFIGVWLGKHKLCPQLSPKKTIEGALGGILGGSILALLYGYFLQRYVSVGIENFSFVCFLIGIAGAALSQLGDLSASAIKRFTKIKDFGKLIPGHGGVLDRFDSILFTAPFVYYVLQCILF
ncbi:MAG: phosphatidate cytidylyltransferase [Epulopiscium sp.]|nr:phosphatidate cytidylyltransferase [Candidatus Epulonipiscium sp.]